MPDKDGDDNKSTKSVVKKKTKQMLNQEYIPEEEYDRYRDNILMRGGDHRSKETKEKSYTPSKQPKGQTAAQKAAKGKSALELVKADITKKYGKGAIMNVGKKKVKEELDLTKIAEAFGGYVVEANGKNGKKNNKKRDSIDDFIDAENPFDVKAKKDAQRDIEDTGGTDTRSSFTRQDSFQKSGKFKQPETNPLRKKDGEIEPDSVKFTKKPGEATVKSYIDPSQIDPKIAAREKAKRVRKKTIEKSPETIKQKQERKKGGQEFKRTGKITKDDDESLSKDLKKTTEGPTKARKRRSDARSFDQVKADIDIADAAKRAKKIGEYSPEYEDDLSDEQRRKFKKEVIKSKEEKQEQEKAYQKDLAKARSKGGRTALPQSPTKTPQGQPQKGQSDASQEFNRQQNQLRRLQRQGMADSGANPFPQEPLPEIDPSRRPSSPFASTINPKGNKPFNIFRKDSKPEPDPSQTQYLDKESGRRFDMDNPKDRQEYLRQQGKDKFIQQAPDKRSKVELGADANYDPDEGGKFTAQRGGESLTRKPVAKTNFGREFGTMMTDMQKAQQSFVGALGGVFAKGLSPATAGAEAGLRYARGDKTGAALSAIQGLGGGLGFGAGVINALRMMNPKGTAKLALKKQVSPEKEAMASAAGAGFVTQARDTLSRLRVPELPNKERAIRVSAKQ